MNAGRTARDRARAELTAEIKQEARRQLAVDGPQKLSLRSVARELGMVSSALYRYFPSRDDLLTALIIDAYNAMGDAAEKGMQGSGARARWASACHAVRSWAKENPHEYALIYGSPIPGYQAPRDTVVAAGRVPLLFVGLIREVWAAGELRPGFQARPLTGQLASQLSRLAEDIAPELPTDVLSRLIVVWSQLFGMISFELFGQFVGSVDPTDEFFAYAVDQLLDFLGLPA